MVEARVRAAADFYEMEIPEGPPDFAFEGLECKEGLLVWVPEGRVLLLDAGIPVADHLRNVKEITPGQSGWGRFAVTNGGWNLALKAEDAHALRDAISRAKT